MKSILGRLSKLEEQNEEPILPPVFVNSLDELDTCKRYSVIFCESEDIHRAQEYTYKTLFYGGIEQ